MERGGGKGEDSRGVGRGREERGARGAMVSAWQTQCTFVIADTTHFGRHNMNVICRMSQPKPPCCHITVTLYNIVEQHSPTVAYK